MIIVATLGTGKYQETGYCLADRPESVCRTCYGPVATAVLLGGIDEAVLLLTREAETAHWEVVRREFETRGIRARSLAIPVGRTAAEIWQVVKLLNDAIGDSSELVIDITHALRHLPVLMLASIAYLTAEKRVQIHGIYYGAFEARHGDRTPVFELTPFLGLIDGYHALRRFRETGDARPLAASLLRINSGLWQQDMGSPHVSAMVRSLKAVGSSLISALPLEAGIHARNALNRIEEAIEHLPPTSGVADSLIRAIIPTLERIALKCYAAEKNAVPLTLSEIDRQLEFIRFSMESQACDRALLLLREWVISRCLLAEGKTEAWLDYHEARKPMESALSSLKERIKAGGCAVAGAQHELAGIWDGLAERRNRLAHAGMCYERVGIESIAAHVGALLEKCTGLCADDDNWRLDRGASGGDLLVTPLGLSPGVLYTALMCVRPDRALVLTSGEGARRIGQICERAGYPESLLHVEIVGDAHRCFDSRDDLLARVRPHVMAARCVVVNVTGGTTALQYLAERLGREAERFGVPVRRIALVDARPYEYQQADPFVCGEMITLEETGR